MGEKFKTYCCNRFPFLKVGTRIPHGNGHVTIHFGEAGTAGLYTAQSKQEEEAIESCRSFGVDIFPFDQGKDAEEIREQEAVVAAPKKSRKKKSAAA